MPDLVKIPKENIYVKTPGSTIRRYAIDGKIDRYFNKAMIFEVLYQYGLGPNERPIHIIKFNNGQKNFELATDNDGLLILGIS